MKKDDKMVEVYRATGEMEAQIIKSLLESYGIPSLIKSNAAPSVHVIMADGLGIFSVMVWESIAEKARGLIGRGEDV